MRKLLLVLSLLSIFFIGTSMKTSEIMETPPTYKKLCWTSAIRWWI